MVKAELVLGSLKAVFDSPAMAFDGGEGLDARAERAPCREDGEITVADIAADQEAARPQPRFRLIIFVGVEISEFAVSPVMEPGALGALACRKMPPCAWS